MPLPDGKSWRIDDHTQPFLFAEHAATSSKVWLYTSFEHELVNHRACEERARTAGLVPAIDLRTVEDAVTVGPDAFDTRVWVAIGQKGKDAPSLTGHLFLFGAYVRECLFVHLETSVPSREDEPKLSARLASARVTIVSGIKLDPPRTNVDVDLPREKTPTTK